MHSRKRNICDVSAPYRMIAWHMQRTCVAAALTARVRHHDVNLTACVRHHATTHTCTHTGACPCCIMILPLITHAPSIFPSSLPHMSTHPALHDTACVPHVHGRRHTWVKMQRFMSVALLARSPGARCNLLFLVAMPRCPADRSSGSCGWQDYGWQDGNSSSSG